MTTAVWTRPAWCHHFVIWGGLRTIVSFFCWCHRFVLFLCHHLVIWAGFCASISYFRWCHHFIIWSLDHRMQVHRSFNILSLRSKTGVLFYKWCVTKARMCGKSLVMILQNWWHRSSMSQALFVQFVSWKLRLCIFTIKLSSRLCLAMVMSFFLELYMHTFFRTDEVYLLNFSNLKCIPRGLLVQHIHVNPEESVNLFEDMGLWLKNSCSLQMIRPYVVTMWFWQKNRCF